MIPTYSFPVDSINLDVLQGKWSKRSDIELSRDARLGIVEYAPGAEVIANGRVWTSRAIAQYPREFMPPFFYKICENCRHIEAWEDQSLIPSRCSSCNFELKAAVRQFIEPFGFTTALGESTGKEPGQRREMPPRALETQLIGNAPDHLFRGSDLLKVEWALQNAQEGRMVVINRGNGDGFVKCGCGYARAVTGKHRETGQHKSPITDHDCALKSSKWKFDLAHTFHTDVLQIRCSVPVPEPELPEPDPENSEILLAMDGVARSACEALRLGCCQMLDIPEMEISATFRWLPNQGLEIILFDNVPGGAGYTAKIYELKASQLLRYAKDVILECSEECSKSCSKCLRSYSNQMYWESFRRLDAIAWLDKVLYLERLDPRVQLGAEEISLRQVNKLCEDASKIVISRDRFGDFTGGIDTDNRGRELPFVELFPEWKLINQWLCARKNVILICRQFPKFDDPSLPRARRCAEMLLPHVRDGRLSLIMSAGEGGVEDLTDAPDTVIFNNENGQSSLIYNISGNGAILENLWSDPVLVREVTVQAGDNFVRRGSKIEMTALERPDSIQRYHYSSHEARNFERDFDFLSSGKIHSIEITDRYMTASESAKEALFKFLTVIADLWAVPPKTIILQHGPARNQQDRTKWIKNMDWVVKQLSKDNRFAEIELKTPFRGTNRVRNFHDRRVVALFEAVSSQCMPTRKASRRRRPPSDSLRKSLVTAELTGGIDILLDKREETTVFVIDQRIQ